MTVIAQTIDKAQPVRHLINASFLRQDCLSVPRRRMPTTESLALSGENGDGSPSSYSTLRLVSMFCRSTAVE